MPVIDWQVIDDWNKDGVSLTIILLHNVQEVIVLKQTHGSVSDSHFLAADAFSDSFEELRDQMADLASFNNFEDFL